jgi:AcrR family transcriptional regulator
MLTIVNKRRPLAPTAAALALLRREGPAALTMRNVAAEAGVTATALYRHFDDKTALLHAVVHEVYAVFHDHMIGELPGDSAAALSVACDRYLRFARSYPNYYRLLFAEPHEIGIDRYPKDFQSGRSPTFRALKSLVARCVADGVLSSGNEADIALTLYAHMHGLVMLHLAGRFQYNETLFERFYQDSIARLIDGLR